MCTGASHTRKEIPCPSEQTDLRAYVGNPGSIPGWRRSPGEGNGNPLQYSCLENPTDSTAHGHKQLNTTEQLMLSLSSFMSS